MGIYMGVIIGIFKIIVNAVKFAFKSILFVLHSVLCLLLTVLYIPAAIIKFSILCTFAFIYVLLFVLFTWLKMGGNPFLKILLLFRSGFMFEKKGLILVIAVGVLTLMLTIIFRRISYKIEEWFYGSIVYNREMRKTFKVYIRNMKNAMSYIDYGSPEKEEAKKMEMFKNTPIYIFYDKNNKGSQS